MEKGENAGSRWELNPGHVACALPLSYDNHEWPSGVRTTEAF